MGTIKSKSLLFIIAGVLMVLLSSCMHLMMSDNHSHSDHTMLTTKVFSNDSMDVTITFPTLTTEKQSKIVIEILNASTKQNLTAQSVEATVFMYMNGSHIGHREMKHDDNHAMNPQVIALTLDSSGQRYEGNFTLKMKGSYQFIITIGGEHLFKFSFTENIGSNSSDHSMGMMGMGSSTQTYTVLGAIAMIGIMVVMFTVRGGMF
ncbi:MAG: hypothetical protein PHP42_02870 [Bacteroidota bacterium]|nr:hypothetical protein [Bacteroidota bacterium]